MDRAYAKIVWQWKERILRTTFDDLSANWLCMKAAANNTTPEAIIGEWVREQIKKAVS